MNNRVSEIQVSYKPSVGRRPVITSSLEAYNELIGSYKKDIIALQEMFVVMYLNRANRVIGVYPMSRGGITGTVVDIRLLLSVALKTASTSIILSHNHPSSNLKPSVSDRELTNKIKDACSLFDIKLQDHIILSPEESYLSFADEGLL